MSNSQNLPQNGSTARIPAGAPSWVTADLIERTIKIWQPFYTNPLIPEDALEMIMGVDQLFSVVSRTTNNEEICGTRKSQQS